MTIHSEHPFAPDEPDRTPVRRIRGRMPLPVSIWTTVHQGRRAGWTVSSLLVADGEPAEVLGLVDEDSDLAALAGRAGVLAVSLLGWRHRSLGDAFAGLAPAPGGAFRLGSWRDTDWGPVLTDAVGWVGVRLLPGKPTYAGWTLLLRGTVERAEVGAGTDVLGYLRGRYRSLSLDS